MSSIFSGINEAANPAQQAAIAIAMKKAGKKPKNEDYTGVDGSSPAGPFASEKTPEENPYGGMKSNKFRGAISETPNESPVGYQPSGWRVVKTKPAGLDEEQVNEISPETVKDYIRKNVEDQILRSTGSSFASGKKGDLYNKANITHQDKMRQRGLDRALNKLSPTNEAANTDQITKLKTAQQKAMMTAKAIKQQEYELMTILAEINNIAKSVGVNLDYHLTDVKDAIRGLENTFYTAAHEPFQDMIDYIESNDSEPLHELDTWDNAEHYTAVPAGLKEATGYFDEKHPKHDELVKNGYKHSYERVGNKMMHRYSKEGPITDLHKYDNKEKDTAGISEAPGPETLAHNQRTEKQNLKAFGLAEDELDENCWKGYHKEGMKKMFGKKYPNCVKNTKESAIIKGLRK